MHPNPKAEAKLDAWLGPGTWDSSHALNMDRWYDFVDQYQRDHGDTIDEAALRKHIEHKVEGDVNDHLREIIRKRFSLTYDILDFLKRTGR